MKTNAVLRLALFGSALSGFIIANTCNYVEAQLQQNERVGIDRDLERRLEQTARERGVLESASADEIRSPVPSTVLWMLPEGTVAKKGDLLISLDTSKIEEQLPAQEIVVHTSKAQLIQAKSAVEALKVQTAAGTAAAENVVKVAELALRRFIAEGGEFDLRIKEVDSQLKLARERLKTAERLHELEKHDDRERLAASFAVIEAQESLRIAEAKKKWLNDYVREHEQAKLELTLQNAELDMSRAKYDLSRRVVQADAQLAEHESTLAVAERRLARLKERLAGCRIHARRDGLVVYVNASRRYGDPIEEGAEVREGQRLLRLVDMAHLQLRVLVHESRLVQVRRGQPVAIRFDAFPAQTFRGEVVRINATPEPASWFDEGAKSYAVVVSIDKPHPGLRIGMTAVAEIDLSAGADPAQPQQPPSQE